MIFAPTPVLCRRLCVRGSRPTAPQGFPLPQGGGGHEVCCSARKDWPESHTWSVVILVMDPDNHEPLNSSGRKHFNMLVFLMHTAGHKLDTFIKTVDLEVDP